MFYCQISNPDSSLSVVIEDDGKVAYAYLLREEKIISHVWLYNISVAQIQPEWETNREMPFLNARNFVETTFFEPIADKDVVMVKWFSRKDGELAAIFVRDQFHAVLKEGFTPGWCSLVRVSGPLANRLIEAPK